MLLVNIHMSGSGVECRIYSAYDVAKIVTVILIHLCMHKKNM